MHVGIRPRVFRPVAAVIAIAVSMVASCDVDVEVTVDDGDDDIVGSGTVVTERREVADIERVVLVGEGRIELTQGDAESLRVTADDNLLEHIVTDVADGTLEIRTATDIDIEPATPVVYEVGVIDLDEIELTGVGTIDVGEWSTDAAAVRLSGVGDIVIEELVADGLAVDHNGVGDITVAGSVDEQDVSMSGVGDYEAGDLSSGRTTVDATGPTETTVWATDSIDLQVTGPAKVAYYGEPDVERDVRGNGAVMALGPK